MTFRNQLDKAHKAAIDIGSAFIAQEVAEYEGFSCVLNPDEFEHICQTIHSLWIQYSYSVSALVSTIGSLISEKKVRPLDINEKLIMENYNED